MTTRDPHADELTVRRPRQSDLDAVIKIENASFTDPWPAFSLLAELEVDQRRRPLIGEIEGRIVGYLMAWIAADEYHIVNIAVASRRRRNGFATRLLCAGIEEARREQCRIATLEVRFSNQAARRFYERQGFYQVGCRRGYYSDNGEDALILTRFLLTQEDTI